MLINQYILNIYYTNKFTIISIFKLFSNIKTETLKEEKSYKTCKNNLIKYNF